MAWSQALYIIIVGAGEVGSYLARILVEEQNDVAIIEINEQVARKLEASLDALVVHGSGVSRETFKRAGIAKADMVLAVTEVDEVNLIACMTAMKFGNNPRTVARVREVQYLTGETSLSADDLGLDLIIGPERAVANEVVKLLTYKGSGEIAYLAEGQVALLKLPLSADSPLVHESLAELRDVFPTPSLVAAVAGPEGLRIPRGDDVLKVNERAYVLTVPELVNEFWILSGKPWHSVRHVLIVGCGDIGFHLARELESIHLAPTIIEDDRERAKWVSKHLPKSIVLLGDGTDPDLLREQLDERSDAVAVLIDDDEKAILVGLFAKHLGAKKVIVRSDKFAYAPIAHRLGVDSLISPERAIANEILKFARRGIIHSAHMLGDHEGEIFELQIPKKPAADSEIVGRPLREISFPEGVLLGAVVHDGKVSIATGTTVLHPGDDLLVVALNKAIPKLGKLIS